MKAGRGGDSNVVRDQLAHAISRMLRATFGDRINRFVPFNWIRSFSPSSKQ